MKSSMPYRGLTAPQLKALLRPILADPAYRIDERGDWERAVRELWDGATHREERYAATALTGHRAYRGWQDPDAVPLYRHLVVTGAWWDHVDEVASNRIGPILLSHNEDRDAHRPRVGDRRRPVAAAHRDHQPADVQGAHRPRACCAKPSSPTSTDTSFWIRKAIGWALRQYARTDPDWVRATVAEYGDRLSGLSRREALKHL